MAAKSLTPVEAQALVVTNQALKLALHMTTNGGRSQSAVRGPYWMTDLQRKRLVRAWKACKSGQKEAIYTTKAIVNNATGRNYAFAEQEITIDLSLLLVIE